jgi:effector-binding domain-containing protein
MLHVTREASMDPGKIAAVMGEAFGAIQSFLGHTGMKPADPPLALYRDWDGQTMQVDVGFPVSPADAARADGEVQAGQIPEGKALKAVHRGSYARLQETYEAMEAHVKETGLKTREIAWEVYMNDPVSAPEDELVTELYMPLA